MHVHCSEDPDRVAVTAGQPRDGRVAHHLADICHNERHAERQHELNEIDVHTDDDLLVVRL